MALRGNAGFQYNAGAGTVTVPLEWPLRWTAPSTSRARFVAESMDRTHREVLVVGSGVAELTAEIRFHLDAAELQAMLDAGADGYTLTYLPDLAQPGTSYPMELLEPSGDRISLTRDDAPRRWRTEIRVRHASGGNFDGLL